MRARTAFVTATLLAATLAACGSGNNDQGKAERATAAPANSPSKTADCSPDSSLPQADWITQCGSANTTPAADQPDTELTTGDTFAYKDGMKVKVTSFAKITRYGEYDTKPAADKLAFRVTWTVTNNTNKPYDLDGLSYNAEGATAGGDTEAIFVDADSKQMTGRIAPGRSGTFTAEYAIAKTDGTTVLFTMSRTDDAWLADGSFLGENPHWTGSIK